MTLKMRLFPRVWIVILLLITTLIAVIAFARIRRAEPRLIPAATSSARPALFAGLPTAPQDPSETPRSSSAAAGPEGMDGAPIYLIIPVLDARPNDLRDTFDAIRSGGRTHRAIDIIAPRGTPVLAAADGKIIRLSRNKRGGNTIYQMSAQMRDDKRLVFYYAHLDRYADDIAPGDYALQGDVIGYVGNTGNAGASNCHLHFSIWAITDPKKYWKGDNINPYPILRAADDAASERLRNKRK